MKLYSTPDELLHLGTAGAASHRPRAKDRDSGLSCWDDYDRMVEARAEMGAPLEKGQPYVVYDTSKLADLFVIDPDPDLLGHWLVKPADPSKMDEWIEQRPTHPLTEALQRAIIEPKVRKIR